LQAVCGEGVVGSMFCGFHGLFVGFWGRIRLLDLCTSGGDFSVLIFVL
jgi:hypothetical protein